MDGADYRELPTNGGVEDLIMLDKLRKRTSLPSPGRLGGRQARAQLPDNRADLKWSGGEGRILTKIEVRRSKAKCPSRRCLRQSLMLGLYLHIPFCSAICNYCNFNRGLFDGAQKAR